MPLSNLLLHLSGTCFFVDTNNHRIQFFDEEGRFLRQFGRSGKQSGQLFYPRKVAYFQETNKLVVCDRGSDRSRLQIFDRNGNCENVISLDFVAIVAGMTTYRHWVRIILCSIPFMKTFMFPSRLIGSSFTSNLTDSKSRNNQI